MATKKLKTKIRRELIVQEALKLLADHGLKELRINDLAEKVGLVPSGIYRHFLSKDDIVDAVLDFVHISLLANIESVRQDINDSFICLKKLLELHLNMVMKNPGIPRLVFSEVIFSEGTRAKIKVSQIIESFLSEVQDIIRLGQENGQVRLTLQPRTGAVCFLGLILPPVILLKVTDGKFDPQSHLQQSWPLFVELLQGRCSPR